MEKSSSSSAVVVASVGARMAQGAAWGFWLGLAALLLGLVIGLATDAQGTLWTTLVLVPPLVGIAFAAWRASRISLSLGSDRVEIRNFIRTAVLEVGSIRSIVGTASSFPAPLQCAGFEMISGAKPIAVESTASWGWRVGRRPSQQAQRVAEDLRVWAASVGIPLALGPADLF